MDGLCRFGCTIDESVHHTFFSCELAKPAWFGCFILRPPFHLSTNGILDWPKQFPLAIKVNDLVVKGVISLLNDIWLKHNHAAHYGKTPHPQDNIRDSQFIVSFCSMAFSSSPCFYC